ncbi:MAG: MATE family efflux transporter [Lachnospiraceae bacterium]|nr:MATE family efflux transporter [Lachnospiraceae bacterium]
MRRLIGTKDFYKKTILIALPIMIQNGITNFVGMLDNIMVGRVGTDSMSGVAIVNQLLFIFNLCIFGGLTGIGIFTSQYYGSGDEEGVRDTVRLQVIIAAVLTALGTGILWLFSDHLIGLYLHSDGGVGNVARTFHFAKEYLLIMYAGLLPFALGQAYSGTLRATGETMVPMYAGVAAVLVNLLGNYILIFGKFGAPAMGAAGAAAATVISRFVELILVAGWTHMHADRYPFIKGVYRHLFVIPAWKVRKMITRALPLLANEALWSGAQATLNQCYSVRGLSVVAATNIFSTIVNVFNVSFIAMGSAIAIILGQKLGAGEIQKAREDAGKLTLFTILICMMAGILLFMISPFFPQIYNTSDEIKNMASGLIRIEAMFMPMHAYCTACYFILRSGGKTLTTFVFDALLLWVITVPTAWVLAHLTGIPILPMYAIVRASELIKCLIGWRMTKAGTWAQNLTA